MAVETKTRQDEILDEILDKIADELESVPEPERKLRIDAAASHSFAQPQPAKNGTRKNGTSHSPDRS
jgi:hypothetical protein